MTGGLMKRILSVTIASLIPVLSPCAGFAQEKPTKAADDHGAKAVRRSSSESGTFLKDRKRTALVIGNGAYADVPLRNPVVLQGLGFRVQTKINVNHREMDEAVEEFIQNVQNGDVALFYFSGHEIQVKGENYLIPIGDAINSETDVRYKTVPIGSILGKMEESGNRANIVILDACRNNPLKLYFGPLAQVCPHFC
jgi:hypothetical protein